MSAKEFNSLQLPPAPAGEVGLRALQVLLRERSLMATLQEFHHLLGDVFRITLPGFKPVMMAGPQANRFVLVQARDSLSWRPIGDPVTELLQHGVLVEDGQFHDRLRERMNPALHKQQMSNYVEAMWRYTDEITGRWDERGPHDMLDEARRISLLILMQTLFGVDFRPDLPRLWGSILKVLEFISPGLWLLWRGIPRPGYGQAIADVDDYLFHIIERRRQAAGKNEDLLGLLTATEWMSDDLIRDQLLTMLIAGHDTVTASMAWTLYLLGRHPQAMERAQAEVDAILGNAPPTYEASEELNYLDRVIKESLRLYPPIHVGTRRAVNDLTFNDYRLPRGNRVLYSIYLTHRDQTHWQDPHSFNPDRFIRRRGQRTVVPYSYVPFGGGPRNCIGALYGQVEARIVVARLLQTFEFKLEKKDVHLHMGATLEPRPGVLMSVKRRSLA